MATAAATAALAVPVAVAHAEAATAAPAPAPGASAGSPRRSAGTAKPAGARQAKAKPSSRRPLRRRRRRRRAAASTPATASRRRSRRNGNGRSRPEAGGATTAPGAGAFAIPSLPSLQLRDQRRAAGPDPDLPARLRAATGSGPQGPAILAGINAIETAFGTNLGPSSAGAVGWMQFMPETWAMYGVDANGDGVADPNNPEDAIFAAARYLSAAGMPADV